MRDNAVPSGWTLWLMAGGWNLDGICQVGRSPEDLWGEGAGWTWKEDGRSCGQSSFFCET